MPVTIKPIEVKEAIFYIIGNSPLITDRRPDDLTKRQSKDPNDQFKRSYHPYKDTEGLYGFPAMGIKLSIVGAGRFSSANMKYLRGLFFIKGIDDYNMCQLLDISLIDSKTKEPIPISPPKNFIETYPTKKGDLVTQGRALFENWGLGFRLLYPPSEVTAETLKDLIDIAGFHVGIGCKRPEKGDAYGMYNVLRFEEGE